MINKIINSLKTGFSRSRLGNDFLRNGNRQLRTWGDVEVSDHDFYTGYSFAALSKRSKAVARLAPEVMQLKAKIDNPVSPYIEAIKNSKNFTETQFYRATSIYLDLEGIAYLFVLRGKYTDRSGDTYGDIKEVEILNPYTVTRVCDEDGNVGGYIQQRKDGKTREIPKHMIIEFREFDPFDMEKHYALVDAAKSSQYQMKAASAYTGKSLETAKNIPAVISTSVILEKEKFENFIARVEGGGVGKPMFANGSGSIDVKPYPNNLKDAALKDINDISRDELFSVAGVSKTIMGIEQSGVTRESTKVQKDLFYEFETLPTIQTIFDTFNQDYKKHYAEEYKRTGLEIFAINPTSSDHDADLKVADIRKKDFEQFQLMVDTGYDQETAANFVEGKITFSDLPEVKKKDNEVVEESNSNKTTCSCASHTQHNNLDLIVPESSLVSQLHNIQSQVFSSFVSKLNKVKNQVEVEFSESEKLTKTEEASYEREIQAVLLAFYLANIMSVGEQRSGENLQDLGYATMFQLSVSLRNSAKRIAKEVAKSHIDTITKDIYREAAEAFAQGKTNQEVISTLTSRFSDQVSYERAKLVAETEGSRVRSLSKLWADEQMINQNGLTGRAYKKWRTNSSNPCAFCVALEAEGAIPIDQPFRSLGSSVVAGGKTLKVNFMSIEAGTAHPRCRCDYELIIR